MDPSRDPLSLSPRERNREPCGIGGSTKNQTFRHEVTGGYLWSPKPNANGARNHETMREVAPRDLIFSFVDITIPAIGIARS